jgi:hypothetical protein
LCTEGTALLYRHAFGKLHRSMALLLICEVSLTLTRQSSHCKCKHATVPV